MSFYKFRAECSEDVDAFKKLFVGKYSSMNITTPLFPLPDVLVEMESIETLTTIRDTMDRVQDGHVMVESLNYADEYTGDRWYCE